jgi:hypothetical protein
MRAYPIDPDYAVTENGDVFRVRGGRSSPGRPFKLSKYLQKRGYLAVYCAGKQRTIHRIVAQTYLLNPENLPYVAHKNGNRIDNRLDNLYWATPQQNSDDCTAHGTRLVGAQTPQAILSEVDVTAIKALLATKRPRARPYHRDLAAKYGVTRECISRIAQGRNWRHAT